MIKKLLYISIITTVTILMVVTVVLLIYLYKADKVKESERVILLESKEVKEDGFLKKDTGNVGEEAIIRTVFFLQDEKDEKLLSGAYLCFFHKKDKTLDFYYLKGNTVFEISKELYRDLVVGITGLPMLSRLSHFYTYSKSEQGLKSGMFMINDGIGIDLGHFLYLPHKLKKEMFEREGEDKASLKQDFLKLIQTDKKRKNWIKKSYKDEFTDLTDEELEFLLKEFGVVDGKKISFRNLPVTEKNSGSFIIKEEALRLMYGNEE